MPLNQIRCHIIAYDIANKNRLSRVHRYLKKIAMPIQYSVFLLETSSPGMASVMRDLNLLIDPRADDIRSYTLPVKPRVATLGRQKINSGIYLLSSPDGYEMLL